MGSACFSLVTQRISSIANHNSLNEDKFRVQENASILLTLNVSIHVVKCIRCNNSVNILTDSKELIFFVEIACSWKWLGSHSHCNDFFILQSLNDPFLSRKLKTFVITLQICSFQFLIITLVFHEIKSFQMNLFANLFVGWCNANGLVVYTRNINICNLHHER